MLSVSHTDLDDISVIKVKLYFFNLILTHFAGLLLKMGNSFLAIPLTIFVMLFHNACLIQLYKYEAYVL